ncbi:hypothetical protein [Acinetobacter baumannii]|nr:hypothetical protein [Acinetobacter baumannii]
MQKLEFGKLKNKARFKKIPPYIANSLFILAKDVRVDPNLAQLEAIFQGNLTLHNNCLSIIVRGDRETMHTLVIPKQYEVFFDNHNKVIGLKNIKSKELYRLGESLQFSGIAFDDEKMKLGEKLPDGFVA